MQITNIEITNVLGIKNASIEMAKPAVLIAGANGAGKSSIAEAVRHALVAKCARVDHKKDFGALMHNRADAGHAIISTTLGDYGVLLPDGKQTGEAGALPFALDYCLDPTLFAKATANDRRTFLLKLMGVKITAAAIYERLEAMGADADALLEVKPHLASGFEAAHKEAQGFARDEKAMWRGITGETYGAVKAESWQAVKGEALNDSQIKNADKKIADADAHVEQLSARLGELNAQLDNVDAVNSALAKRGAKIAALRETAGTFARIQEKIHRDEKELLGWEAKVSETREKANGTIHKPLTCPHCAGQVVLGGDGKHDVLTAYEGEAQADIEAQAKLPEYTKARDLMQSALANGKRDLLVAENAAKELAELEKDAEAPPADTDVIKAQIDEVSGYLKGAKTNRDLYRKDAQDIKKQQAEIAAADEKTIKAAAHHTAVKAFDFIADCLAPSGIPSEMINSALKPFCERLGELCEIAGWPQVYLTDGMDIVMGDHLYALRSESERWRADAVIALAIADISRAGVVILDRFDVLDLAGRSDALYLIDQLADDTGTVMLFGTLKALPAKLPECMQAVWVENGTAMSRQEAAA